MSTSRHRQSLCEATALVGHSGLRQRQPRLWRQHHWLCTSRLHQPYPMWRQLRLCAQPLYQLRESAVPAPAPPQSWRTPRQCGNRLSTCAIKLLGGLCFVLKRMTPPNLFLGSWTGFTGGKRTASTQRRQQGEVEWFCTQCKQEGRCGVTLEDCCCGSRDVAASNSQTAVAAAETLRRPFGILLLRQQRRCGVTLEDCCCGGSSFRPGGAIDSASVRLSHRSPLLLRKPWWFRECRGGEVASVPAVHLGDDV